MWNKNESPLLSLYPNSNSTLRRKFVVCSFRLFSIRLLIKMDMHIYLSFKKLFSKDEIILYIFPRFSFIHLIMCLGIREFEVFTLVHTDLHHSI